MATQGGASRLAQMQMRFQQKQQQEREQKKLELTGPSKSSLEAGDTKSLNASIGTGKVRQMFDERRQRSTGIDKSYPLKPIPGRTTSGPATTKKSSTMTTTTVRRQVGSVKQVNGRISAVKTEVKETKVHTVNGNGLSTSEHILRHSSHSSTPDNQKILTGGYNGEITVPDFAKLSLEDHNKNNVGAMGDRNNNSSANGRIDSSGNIKLKPVITKKTAPAAPVRTTTRLKPETAVNKSSSTVIRTKTNVRSPPSSASSGISLGSTAQKMSTPSPRTATGPPPENMAKCDICGRNFNMDRIGKHREICQKTATKKRKIFDAAKHRVQGTEIEQYTRKPAKTNAVRSGAAVKGLTNTSAAVDKKSNWRRKHEEFIQAIRAAKEMQVHLARGGKLSDLPPPPPSENPDYVQCPHCMRRFNESAAARHIPKCATMLHNKPKPGAKPVAPSRKR